jgi:hypothetical protein
MKKPLFQKIEPINSKMANEEIQKLDTSFVNMFEGFINNAKINDVNLILTLSPHLNQSNGLKVNKSLELMKSMAFEHGIPLIDFSDDRTFIKQYHLFNDPGHLNNDGAIIFTKLLADTLKVKIELLN